MLKDAYRFLHLEERESFTMIAIASPNGAVPVHNVYIVQSCAPVSKIALRTFCSPGRIHWAIIMPQYTQQGYHVHQMAGCFKMREHSKFIEANTTWIYLAPLWKEIWIKMAQKVHQKTNHANLQILIPGWTTRMSFSNVLATLVCLLTMVCYWQLTQSMT